MNALAASGVGYATRDGKRLLDEVYFTLHAGEIIGLVGANGAGKTTLLKVLAGLIAPSTGYAMLQGQLLESYAPRARARAMAYIAQHTAPAWPLTAQATVALGRIPHGAAIHALHGADADAVERAMAECRVDYLRDRIVNTLSGGEQARVWLARAMATEACVLLADEPTAGLDLHYQLLFMELLQRWRREDRAAIIAIHDLSLAARFCDKLLVLAHGRVRGFDTPDALMREGVLSSAFGVVLHHVQVDGLPMLAATARIEEPCA